MFNYSKLRGKIREVFGSEQTFAAVLGCSKRTLSVKLNNKFDFSQDEILATTKALNIPIEQIGVYFFSEVERENVQSDNG